MNILTERLMLRPVAAGDVEAVFSFAGDADNARYMMFLPYASKEEVCKAIKSSLREWEKPDPKRRDFILEYNKTAIGEITLYFEGEPGEAEIGWILHPDHQRRGYTYEAVTALMAYARENWGVRRVFACCDSENEASRRLMEKLGMRLKSMSGGRHNRSMPGQERIELVYEMQI